MRIYINKIYKVSHFDQFSQFSPKLLTIEKNILDETVSRGTYFGYIVFF